MNPSRNPVLPRIASFCKVATSAGALAMLPLRAALTGVKNGCAGGP
jgi:hypothetical protein